MPPGGGGGGGGGAVTVTADVPVFPEQVAVIVALPAPAPVTTPFEFTVAAALLLVDQTMVCPVMMFPCASLTVADSVAVAPTAIEAVGGDTVTVVTTGGGGGGGEVTVTLAAPDFPADMAVIVAEPAATPVTMPLELTDAVAPLLVDHVIVWPVMTFPCASFTVAESVTVAPTAIEDVGGDTVTVVTTGPGGGGGGGCEGGVTVTSDVPFLPALVALIVAEPAAIPATTPLALTTATASLLVDHEMASPDMTFPSPSFTVAARVVVAPAAIEAVVGETLTVVTTGAGGGVGSVVVPEPEHTEIAGTRMNSHDWRATLRARANIYGMSFLPRRSDFGGRSSRPCCRATKRRRGTDNPLGRIRWRLGWHSGIPR